MLTLKTRSILSVSALLPLLALASCAQPAAEPLGESPAVEPDLRDLYSDTWVATDALGRALPTAAQVGALKSDKQVGIFYFLWQERPDDPPHDLTKMVAANPDKIRGLAACRRFTGGASLCSVITSVSTHSSFASTRKC